MKAGDRVEIALGDTDEAPVVGWEIERLRSGLDPGGDAGSVWTLAEPPSATPTLMRVFSAALEDGTTVGVAAARPPDAVGHGDERIGAFIARCDQDPEPVSDALLSTEYDADGRVRRAGLELWTAEMGPPARGAADRLAPQAEQGPDILPVEQGGLSGESVRMSFRLDGVPGMAIYDLLRPADPRSTSRPAGG